VYNLIPLCSQVYQANERTQFFLFWFGTILWSYSCLGFPRFKKERQWFHENSASSNEETWDKLEAIKLVVQEMNGEH
jgi:hypothetical protein